MYLFVCKRDIFFIFPFFLFWKQSILSEQSLAEVEQHKMVCKLIFKRFRSYTPSYSLYWVMPMLHIFRFKLSYICRGLTLQSVETGHFDIGREIANKTKRGGGLGVYEPFCRTLWCNSSKYAQCGIFRFVRVSRDRDVF